MAVAVFMIEVDRESPAAESSPMALTAQPCTTTSRRRPASASRAGSARWDHIIRAAAISNPTMPQIPTK